jgi:hypothetical protein
LSNGREAPDGSSLRVDMARMSANAPKQSGASGASAPPANITSAYPSRITRNASPTASEPEAQLIALVLFGPIAPRSMAMLQLDAPAKTPSASPGLHRAQPLREEHGELLFRHADPAQGASHHHADALAVLARQIDPRIGDRLLGARHRERAVAVQPLHPLRLT